MSCQINVGAKKRDSFHVFIKYILQMANIFILQIIKFILIILKYNVSILNYAILLFMY